MLSFIQAYPLLLAPFFGIIPALIWLWFWLKEDRHPEPIKMVTLSFLGGMCAVLLVLPVQKLVYIYLSQNEIISFTLWASIEEIFKFAMVYFIALNHKVNDEPIDSMIYLIISALGFVSLENTLFVIDPIHSGDFIGSFLTSNLRFVGASLLHVMSSATIGIFMAVSFYKNHIQKSIYVLIGLILAIALHTAFNLFIINQSEGNIFSVFGSVWIGIILLLLSFEKVKKI